MAKTNTSILDKVPKLATSKYKYETRLSLEEWDHSMIQSVVLLLLKYMDQQNVKDGVESCPFLIETGKQTIKICYGIK